MRVRRGDGAIHVQTKAYRLEVSDGQPIARLWWDGQALPTELMLLASLDSDAGLDGTLACAPAAVQETGGAALVTIEAVSSVWAEKRIRLYCTAQALSLRVEVAGEGRLRSVRLLGGWYSGTPRWGSGLFHSRWHVRKLFVPAPNDPRRLLQAATEPATIGVVGGDMPGRGHWFFTPAPLLLAGTAAEITDPADSRAAQWQLLELRCAIDEANLSELRYEPFGTGFSLSLAYDGQTRVDGRFATPELVIGRAADDPYAALRRHANGLRGDGLAPVVERRQPDWWSRPIFCGWGEQCREARLRGGLGPDYSRRENYERWLEHLAERGIVPGTIVLDDKWQRSYGRNEVDEERWPDLRGWIAQRHSSGQRVLLWFKAWDPDGLPPEACLRDRLGRALAADPDSPAYRQILRDALAEMLGPDGLDADGLKVDFTAQTPAGPAVDGPRPAWGVALLHRLLTLVYRYAKEHKPDALVVTHTPSPLFADVTDMIRLNDLLRLKDPQPWAPAVAQMTHRARVATATDPDWLIDTDDWCMPSRAEWRDYLAAKPSLGVPALYYATGIDHSDEPFEDEDYAAIRQAWAAWESGRRGAVR